MDASEAYAPEDAETMLMEGVQVVMTKAAEETLRAVMPQRVPGRAPPRSEAILRLRRNLAEAQQKREQDPNAQNREDERKAAALLQLQRHEEFNKEVKAVRKMGLSDKNLAKIARAPKISFSPHQKLFHMTRTKRNFILLQEPLGDIIKLYESKSIHGLLTDHRETPSLAINDWEHIQQVLINAPSNA